MCRDVAKSSNEVLDCKIELDLSREFRKRARRQVNCARGLRHDGFGAGLSQLTQLFVVRVFKLKASEQRDGAILNRRVVYVFIKKK